MNSKLLKTIQEQTSLVELATLNYALSNHSKGKPWYKRTDLNGLCYKASKRLQKRLTNLGLQSSVIFGSYNIELAGGNGINMPIEHYWVEIKHGNKTILADPTNRQFAKYLPQGLVVSKKFPFPLATPINNKLAQPYQTKLRY